MIVGTAGHVDHGKTSLVKALTGIDTDRLPEEKRRGITLELGFAHLALPSGRTVGVVDVPGHERFVKAMAAGAGGIDLALLVVAADEGVMPQTREHIDICTLLGLSAGVLVVTKGDLLPGLGEGWLELLEADLRALAVGTPFEHAPLVTVSSKTGEGLDVLKSTLDALATKLAAEPPAPKKGTPAEPPAPFIEARRARGPDAPLFLPIDRAFTAKGFGLVVTGSLWSGRIAVDDELRVLPAGRACRVRSVQVHGAAVQHATSGTRVAVNLPDLSLEDVSRGQVLVHEGQLAASKSVEVTLSLLASVEHPLPRRSRWLLTLGTAQVETLVRLLDVDELRPGERCFAQLHFATPLAALPGQRFILRGTRALEGRGATVGGGIIEVLSPPRRKPGRSERLAQLTAAPLEERVRLLLVDAGYAGLEETVLAARARAPKKDLTRALELITARGAAVLVEKEVRRFVATEVLEALSARMVARLDALHLANPERAGTPREELRQRVGQPPERVFQRALEGLFTTRRVELSAEVLRLPGRGRAFTGETSSRQQALRAALEGRGLQPPTLLELASTLKLTEAEVTRLAQALVAQGLAVRAGELFFARPAIDALQARLLTFFEANERLSTQAFKDLTGLSRKFLIPLAEYFDRERLTLRVGDERVLRRR